MFEALQVARPYISKVLNAFAGAIPTSDGWEIPTLPPDSQLRSDIRAKELEDITSALVDPANSCIACTGGHGMGKSILALQAMRDPSVAAIFKDSRLWINCHAVTDTSNFLELLAEKLHAPPAESLGTIAAAIQLLPVRRRVIVLDDLDHLYSLDTVFTDAVIRTLSGIDGLVLVLTVVGWTPAMHPEIDWSLQLKPLSQKMAQRLFAFIYPPGVFHQRQELAELLNEVGMVPQYIVVLAILASKKKLQPSALLRDLDEIDLLGKQTLGENSKTLEESIHAYAPEERLGYDPHALRVFRVLVSFPGGVPRDRLKAYVGLPMETIDSICNQLSNLSFIHMERQHPTLVKTIRDYAIRSYIVDTETQDILFSQLRALVEIPKSSLRPGNPEFIQIARQFKSEQTNLESIIMQFLDVESPVAVAAALQYLKPLCAVRPSLKLAAKALEVADRKNMPLLPHMLHTVGEAQYRSGNLLVGGLLSRAVVLYRLSEDDESRVGEAECELLQAEIECRRSIGTESEQIKRAVQCAHALSTLTSETGRRGYAYSLLTVGTQFSHPRDKPRLLASARALFRDLDDTYGLALCTLRSGPLQLSDVKTFQDFENFEMAAHCYESAVHDAIPNIEYIKVLGEREQILDELGGDRLEQLVDFLKKSIDIYEMLGQQLNVAFCRYHLAQLLPPKQAENLYSQSIAQFTESAFTHHQHRGTLDRCYSLIEDKKYHLAIPKLEVLQDQIGYCGQIFVVRCRELLTECHFQTGAGRPALHAVRATLGAIEQLPRAYETEARRLRQKYSNLVANLDVIGLDRLFTQTLPLPHSSFVEIEYI